MIQLSQKDKIQDLNPNHLKLEIHDTYKKDEKVTTTFKAVNDSAVINKAYLDQNFLKIDGHLLFLEKNDNEYKLHYNKQSVEEIIIQRAVKKTIQVLYDKN